VVPLLILPAARGISVTPMYRAGPVTVPSPAWAYFPPAAEFGRRLPGPFACCAGAGLAPYPGSLGLASRATTPVLSRYLCGCAGSVAGAPGEVNRISTLSGSFEKESATPARLPAPDARAHVT
jgi:hypothetical protein